MYSSAALEWGVVDRKAMSGFSITEFSQPPNRRLPWHEHRDASICVVLSGSYSERVGRLERECVRHSLVFKPGSVRHADQFGRLGGHCLLVEISPARLEAIERHSTVTTRPTVVRTAALGALGHEIYREFTLGDPWSSLAIEGLVLEVCAEASRALVEERTEHRPTWLRRAHDLIRETFCEATTLSSVAIAVGVHPSHLARAFRRHYRGSIGTYVRRLRIERVSAELADTELPLAEIGLRAGFFDQSHFSRVFKAHTGMTPGEFRARSRARHVRTIAHRAS